MPKQDFPHKSPGQFLEASHINRLSSTLSEVTGRRPGAFSRGSNGDNSTGHPFEQYTLEISNLKIHADDTNTSGLYLGKTRYYSFEGEEWRSDDAEWEVDARDTYLRFEAAVPTADPPIRGHCITAYWDEQRGAFIPVSRVWPPQERKVKLTGTIAVDASGTVNVWENGVITSPLQTHVAWLNWMAGVNNGSNGDEAMIRWMDDESKWVIVNIEC